MGKFKVATGAGHGINTSGKRTPDGEREWSFNNKVVKAFINELKKYEDIEIKRMDNPSGKTDVPLLTRTNNANSWGANVYISFHHNANTGRWGSWTGVETHVYKSKPEGSTALAKAVQPALVDAYGLQDRGIKFTDLHITRETDCDAILIGSGFMDSNIDIKKLRNNSILDKAGRNIAKAVAKHYGLKRKDGKTVEVEKPKKEEVKSKPVKKESKPKSKWTKVTGNWTGQTLKKGQYGEPVKQLQTMLAKKGYLKSSQVDSYYGNITKKAVRKAQKDAGINVDGLAGKATYRTLTKSNKSKSNLKIDKKWGQSTTRALQKTLGTPVDGIISNQPRNSVTNALYGGVTFGSKGSPMVKSLQKKVGAKQDGKLGSDTVRHLQKYLGTPQDGKISRPTSLMVGELQKRLNKGSF